MKPNFRTYAVSLLLTAMAGWITLEAAEPFPGKKLNLPVEDEPAKKKKSRAKSESSLNNAAVKIYPDAFKRAMHVIAKGTEKQQIEFFVFDLQGTLMQNHKMKARDHIRIEGLARGSYIYRVFSGDEETASGQFEIR